MFDGIKLDCYYLDGSTWRENDKLNFALTVDAKTGEVLPVAEVAKLNGLTFKLTPSGIEPGKVHCTIEGSIHRFYNGGAHNATDYTLANIGQTIGHLAEQFQIIPEKTILRNLEFGVNISLPITAQQFLDGVVCMPEKRFVQMNISTPKMGWICQRVEYGFKVYDKGKQSGQDIDNLLRVEVKVNKMRYLSKYSIKTLADLIDLDKVLILGELLTKLFGDMVYYDGSINPKVLTPGDRTRLEKYTNPRRWLQLDRQARHKFRKSMERFMIIHGANQVKNYALFCIQNKVVELMNNQRVKGDDFTAFFSNVPAHKKVTISPLECRVNMSPLRDKKLPKNKKAENPQNAPYPDGHNTPHIDRTFCRECGRDISHQKKDSRYCSEKYFGSQGKRCRNRYNDRLRTTRNQETRRKECEALETLLQQWPFEGLHLVVYWIGDGGTQSMAADWRAFVGLDYRTRRRVKRIDAHQPGRALMVFTTRRAKTLIKSLSLKAMDL